MRRYFTTSAFLLLACADASSVQEATPDAQRLLPRVLVVSGANNHDWEWTTPSLVQILERSGRFAVDVTYEPAKTFAEDDALTRYSALVLDYNGPRWGEAAEARFLAAVGEDHVGVVVVHAADNAFPGWVEYEELVGDLWREGTGHGSFHPFDVDIVDRDHPLTATLPTLLKHPDELYHRLVNTQRVARRVLASAFSDPASGGTGAHEPMVLVKDWRGARVVHTPLGHVWRNVPTSQASHRDPQFRGLVVRCTEWAATGAVSDELTRALTPTETAAGWRSLADLAQWQPRDPARPSGWQQRGECIMCPAGAGSHDLVSAVPYGDFELEFEWKTTIAGNSGVKYRVPEGTGGIVAPEYQLLEGAATEGPKHRAGSLYDVYPCEAPTLAPWGSFNRSRIVVRGAQIEHWLNGVRTVAARVGSDDFEAHRAASKFKDAAEFGRGPRGRIALQDHGDEVWFRGLRVRDLSALDERAEEILPAADLAGWSHVGDAVFAREGDELRGHFGPKQRQSFLVSEREFGDFVFEVELRFDSEGNSGLQVRSHVTDGRMVGYQIEVDPSDRSWSGGLYEEGRRGWLDDLAGDDVAQRAFDKAGWNRYRIECIGPSLRAWVNGIETADHLDARDLTGAIAFQVHGGDPDIALRWRNARVTDLGRHAWEPHGGFLLQGEELVPGRRQWLTSHEQAAGVRFVLAAQSASVQLGDYEVDLTHAKNWRSGQDVTVTVLSHLGRVALLVDDVVLVDLPGALSADPDGAGWLALGVTVEADATVRGWQQLTPVR